MKCYLHIGTEKTATTTLQRFFQINREYLGKQGYLYTESAGKLNNRKLPVLAYNLDRRDEFTRANNIKTNQELAEYKKKIYKNLSREIKKNKNKITIFSSEHIQSRLTTNEEVNELRNVLESLGFKEIKIIIYLRNPAEIVNSLYSTDIKTGGLSDKPPSPGNKYYDNICNHKATIERYSSIFGEETIIPRLFIKDEFYNHSVIEDFLNITGLKLTDEYQLPGKENESLSLTGLELLRRINKKIPVFNESGINPERSNLVNIFEKYFSNDKYQMPDELYMQYNEAFRDSNEWVRKIYFPEKKELFPSKVPDNNQNNISTPINLDEIAEFIIHIWKTGKS